MLTFLGPTRGMEHAHIISAALTIVCSGCLHSSPLFLKDCQVDQNTLFRFEDGERCCRTESERLRANLDFFDESQAKPVGDTYRIFFNPPSLRRSMVELSLPEHVLRIKRADPRSFCGGRVFWSCEKALTAEEWAAFHGRMVQSGFWEMPTETPVVDIRLLETDDDLLVVEGFWGARHHFVTRSRGENAAFWSSVTRGVATCDDADRCCLMDADFGRPLQ